MSKDPEATKDTGSRLPLLRIGLVALLAILIAIVVLQNTESVETRILFTTLIMPRAVLLFTTLALGFILGLTVAFLRHRSRK